MARSFRWGNGLSLAWVALTAGCASTPNGVVSLEARGAIDSPVVIDAARIFLEAFGEGGASSGSYARSVDESSTYHEPDDPGLFVRNYGLRASINTDVVDLVAGVDEHSFGSQDLREVNFGLRLRPESSESGSGYIEVLYRRGYDIETADGIEDYDGLAIGVGFLTPIDKHWFYDLSLSVEWTLERLDLGGDNSRLSNVLFNIGLGFSL